MATDKEIRETGNDLALQAIRRLKTKKTITGDDLKGLGSFLNALRKWGKKQGGFNSGEPDLDDMTPEQREEYMMIHGDSSHFAENKE